MVAEVGFTKRGNNQKKIESFKVHQSQRLEQIMQNYHVSLESMLNTNLEKVTTFELERQYIDLVTDCVFKEYAELRKLALKLGYSENAFSIPDKKFKYKSNGKGARPIRPTTVFSVYQLGKGFFRKEENKTFLTIIALVIELVICVQYYHNQILDEKGGVIREKQIASHIESARQLKRIIYQYVDVSFSNNLSQKQKVHDFCNRAFLYVDIGQMIQFEFNTSDAFLNLESKDFNLKRFIDSTFQSLTFKIYNAKEIKRDKRKLLENNIVEGLGEFDYQKTFGSSIGTEISNYMEFDSIKEILDFCVMKDPSKTQFIKFYSKRISLTCKALYHLGTKLVLDLTECEKARKKQILDFVSGFGIIRQMVNDISDNIPTSHSYATKTKYRTDAYADLRNDNITLVSLLHLLKLSDAEEQRTFLKRINQLKINKGLEKQVYEEFLCSHAMYEACSLVRLTARNLGTLIDIDITSSDCLLDKVGVFLYALNIADFNKYYKVFYDEKKYYKSWLGSKERKQLKNFFIQEGYQRI